MNAYQKAQRLGLVGSDQEIVDQLKAIKVTPNKIGIADLKFLMRERGMLVKLTYEDPYTGMKWNGTVPNMIVALKTMGHPALNAVNKWFSHLTDPDSTYFDTTNPVIAGEFDVLATAFGGQPTMPTVEDFRAVTNLGGGIIGDTYSELTAEVFASQRQALLNEVAEAERASMISNAISQAVAAMQQFIAENSNVTMEQAAGKFAEILAVHWS